MTIFVSLIFNPTLANGLKSSTYGSSSTTKQNKNSVGTEKITVRTTQSSLMSGNTDSQTMSISISGQGMDGNIGPVISGSLKNMMINSNGDLMINQAAFSDDQPAEMEAGISAQLKANDSFSLSTQVDLTKQNAIIESAETKETLVELDEDFVQSSFTESFTSETGKYSGM